MYEKVKEAVAYIQGITDFKPKVGLILGSGLGQLADELKSVATIDYGDIPNFPVSTVKSHKGRLIFCELEDTPVVIMQGRVHHYEGYSIKDVTFPVRVMKELGCDTLFLTNASGGINRDFYPGDFMLITDHINFLGGNPLIGPNEEKWGVRFPDMTEIYSKELIRLAETTAEDESITLRKGIYISVTGPSFETPAEIRFFERIGCDAVGMSTVPEAIVGNSMGMKVIGISCITNAAAGLLHERLTSEDVRITATRVRPVFKKLVRAIVSKL